MSKWAEDIFKVVRFDINLAAESDGDRLNAGEVRMLAFSVLLAGTDTTRTQLGASMQVLCDHPEQFALLRDRPELAMNAVEETMRHSPSMCSTVRCAIKGRYRR